MAKTPVSKTFYLSTAWNGRKYSQSSDVPEFTPPSSLSVTPSGTTNSLSWTNGTASAQTKVLRSPTEFGAYQLMQTVAAGASSYEDTNLSNGSYWYKIEHVSSNGSTSAQTSAVNGVISGGSTSGQITVTGSGFGTGPTVVMFDRFNGQTVGDTVNQIADIGAWNAVGPPLFPNRPPIVEFDGRYGVTHNNQTNGTTRYGLIVTGLPQHTKHFTSFKLGVPTGKYFPGAQAVEAFPSVNGSYLKVSWSSGVSSHPSATSDNPDMCSLTFIPGARSLGNNITGPYRGSLQSHWVWNKWNTIREFWSPDPSVVDGPNGSYNMNVHNTRGMLSMLTGAFRCFESYSGGLTAMYFDRVSFLSWSGNADMSNAQLLGGHFYRAIGDNSDKHIILGNASTLSACTNAVDVIAPDSWTDTEIKFTPTEAERAANTHYFIMRDQTLLASGALP